MRTKSKARCAGADGYQNPASVERGKRLSGGVTPGGRGAGPGGGERVPVEAVLFLVVAEIS